MITDLIRFTVKEDQIEKAMELMKQQMKNNLGDEGCLISSAFRSKTDPNELYVLLGWENPEAIEKHLKSAHDNKFREDLDPLLACPPDFYDWEKIS